MPTITVTPGTRVRLTCVGINAAGQKVPPATPPVWTQSGPTHVALSNQTPDGTEIDALALSAAGTSIVTATVTGPLSTTYTIVVVLPVPTSLEIDVGPAQPLTPATGVANTGLGLGYGQAPQGSLPI